MKFKSSVNKLKCRIMFCRSIFMIILNVVLFVDATNYYIDSDNGNNNFVGTIRTSPWKNFDKVNNTVLILQPGDSILLKRGTVNKYTGDSWRGNIFTSTGIWGVLTPRGNGTYQAPIVIGAYESGSIPVIDASGSTGRCAGIVLWDQDDWTIENVEILNDHPADSYIRWGILVYYTAKNSNTIHKGIKIKSNYIHNVIGRNDKAANLYYNGGIYIWVETEAANVAGTQHNTRIDSVLIENNTVENIIGEGIFFRGETVWNSSDNTMNWNNLSTNVVIRENTIRNVCDGIQVNGTDSVLIEHNVIDKAGGTGEWTSDNPAANRTNANATGAIAAVWSACSKGGIIQNNEVMNTVRLPWDGCAFDNDLCNIGDLIIQYNYSHDNEGGFFIDYHEEAKFEFNVANLSTRTIIRYNISQNDGKQASNIIDRSARENDSCYTLQFAKKHGDVLIYNNVFYDDSNKILIHDHSDNINSERNITFENNIFKSNTIAFELQTHSLFKILFNANCFFGGITNNSLINDNNAILEDPLFINGGNAGNGIETARYYKLQPKSSCVNKGILINSNGGRDFWGARLYKNSPDIGAAEWAPDITPIINLLLD